MDLCDKKTGIAGSYNVKIAQSNIYARMDAKQLLEIFINAMALEMNICANISLTRQSDK